MRQVYLIEMKNDLFDISKRLKEIDSGYAVFYNKKELCFEVHNTGQKGNTFCLKVPYEKLDQRTVDLVNSTRVCKSQKIFQEIELQNEKLEKAKSNAAVERAFHKMED